MIQSMIDRISTLTLCKVMAVTNSGAVDAVGFVDLLPLVNQLDGDGNATPYVTPIYGCPYFRLQGGTNAFIIDPQVGDIGIALFAERDISSAIANKGQANPGTARRYDKSDGLYLGGVLNGIPTQFVQMNTTGIRISSPTQIKLDAPDIQLTAGTSIEITAPTVTLAASTSATVTTPTFTVNGATVLNGGLSATGTVSAPTVAAATSLTVAGTQMAAHRHSTSTNPSGTPI